MLLLKMQAIVSDFFLPSVIITQYNPINGFGQDFIMSRVLHMDYLNVHIMRSIFVKNA